MLCNFSANAPTLERPHQNAFVKFNLMVPADSQTTSALSIRRSNASKVESCHVENLGKSRFRSLAGPGLSCRFICAICARRRFAGNRKCAHQRRSAGPGKRWRNEQCGGRSERNRKRFQGGCAAAAAHIGPEDSEVQVRRSGQPLAVLWPRNLCAAPPLVSGSIFRVRR
jgi:hypothetical protein